MISRIAKYPIEAELGRGGFGRVYRAWDPDVRRPVAIKVLLAEGDPDLLKRFQLEVGTTGSLQHKNIVTIYASGEESGTPYLVMELLEGETLSSLIKNRSPLSILEKVRIMTQVAEGLAYAHSKGVVHRDIKPSNIILLADGVVKIMDFGIALSPNRLTVSMTLDGLIVGTVPYLAPEQFISGTKASEQTDIFAFGDVYYELLTGEHPFLQFGKDLNSIQTAIRTYEPPSLTTLLPDCSEALELLVHRCLAKDRELRYQKFDELLLDNEAILIDLQQELAAAMVREVDALLDQNDLPAALEKVNRAMELDPGNRKVRQLRDKIAENQRKDRIQQRVAALQLEGETHLQSRRFAEAVQSYEAAARHDQNNREVLDQLSGAKARLESHVRANQLVAEARFHQQKGKLPDALERLRQALVLDPSHTDANLLLPRLEEQWERHLAEQRRREAMRVASDLLAGHRYAEALAALEDARAEKPDAPGLAELVARINRERDEEERRARAERFNVALAAAREAIQSGDLKRAGPMIERLGVDYSSEPDAGSVLRDLQDQFRAQVRAQEISRYRQRSADLIRDKLFSEAIGLLSEALRKFPGDPGLERLRSTAQTREHEEAVAEAMRRAGEMRAAGNLQAARDTAVEALHRLGDEPLLVKLAREIDNELAHQRYVAGLETLLHKGRGFMAAGHYSDAIELLADAADYQAEAEVKALAESARTGAAAAEEKRVAAAALARVEALKSDGDWEKALAVLEQALERYPHNSDLSHAAGHLRDQIARAARLSQLAQHREAITGYIERGAWKKAEEALAAAQREFPGESVFYELGKQLAEQMFQARLGEIEVQIRAKLASDDLPQAAEQLEATRTIFSRDPRWQSLADQVEHRQKDRAESLAKALAEVAAEVQARHFDKAIHLLDGASRRFGADPELVEARATAFAAKAHHEREQGLAEAQSRSRQLRSEGRLAEAHQAIAMALERFGETDSLLELQRQVDAEREEQGRRKEDIQRAVANAENFFTRNDLLGATQLLKKAAVQYPAETALTDLLRVAETRLADQQREQAIQKIATEGERLLAANQPAQALEALAEGLRQFPGNARLLQLKSAAEAAKARKEAEELAHQRYVAGLETLLSDGRRLAAAGRFGEAVELLGGAADYQGEAEVKALLESARAEVTAAERRRAQREAAELEEQRRRMKIVTEGERLLAANHPAQALEALAEGLRQFPGNAQLLQLKSAAEAAKARKEAEELAHQRYVAGLETLLSDGRRLVAAGRFGEAVELLGGAADYQGEADVKALLESARAEVTAAERRRAQREAAELEEQRRRIQKIVTEGESLLAENQHARALEAVAQGLGQFPGNARLLQLKSAAETARMRVEEEQRQRRQREEERERALRRAEALLAERRFEEALRIVQEAIQRCGTTAEAAHLEKRLETEVEQERRRATRERDRARLQAMEQQAVAGSRKGTLQKLEQEGRGIAARHLADREMESLAARLQQVIDSSLEARRQRWLALRKPISIGAAATILLGAAVLLVSRISKHPPPIQLIPLEIRSDPQGASIELGDRTCVTPNCRLELPVGRYTVRAELSGYQPFQQPLNVETSQRFGVVDITLQPIPPPPLAQKQSEAGTLAVEAGLPNALVFVDGIARGRTDTRGSFSLPLDARAHRVRVEKTGYRTPPDRSVVIGKASSQSLAFRLTPEPARFELRGAPAGVELRVGGTVLGTTNGSVFTAEVSPGDQVLEIKDGTGGRRLPESFDPGQTLRLDWSSVAPRGNPPAPKPDTSEQEWEAARASSDPAQIQAFLNRYPNSRHTSEAQAQIDGLVWARTNQSDVSSLRAYLDRFPAGAHAKDANTGLATIAWNGVDKKDAQALRSFLTQNPESPFKPEAQKLFDQLETQRLEAERLKGERQQRQDLERARQAQAQAVRAAIDRFNAAFADRQPADLRRVWPGVSKDYADAMNQSLARFVMTLTPAGEVEISGDRASVLCQLTSRTSVPGKKPSEATKAVKVILRNAGDRWLIVDPFANP